MARRPDDESREDQFRWIEIDASDLIYLFRRHLWVLILGPVTGFVLACAVAKCLKPVYATSVEIFLRPNFDKEMQLERTYSKLDDGDSLRSIERALVSDTVILATVDRLGLREDPSFLGKHLEPRELTDAKLLKTIRKRFSAELVPTTRIVELTVEDYSAERTALLARTLIDEFLRHLRKDRNAKEAELRDTLVAQAEAALGRALESEEDLKAFRSDNPGIVVEQDSSIVHEQLLQNGTALNEATAELSQLAGMIQALQDIDPAQDPFRVFQILTNRNSEYLSELLTMHTAAKSDLAIVRGRLKEQHPDYQAAADRLAEVEATLRSYAAEMKSGVASEYDAISRKVASLSGALSGLRKDYVGVKSTSAEFRGIKEEVDRNWNTYSALQQKIMDLDLDPEVTPTFATVTSGPTVPDKKAKPKTLLFAAAGVFLGGLAALGVVLWKNLGGLPFTTARQVARQLRIPTIASLEITPGASPASRLAEIEGSPQFDNLLIALRQVRLVHVTSLLPEPDASLLPWALARHSGIHGRRTLLVSIGRGDGRTPGVRAAAALPGVMSLDLPVHVLFDHQRLRNGLAQLLSRFDLVILETTLAGGDEARFAVAAASQCTILAVHGQGRTPRAAYERFLEGCAAKSAGGTRAVFLSPAAPVPTRRSFPRLPSIPRPRRLLAAS